MGAVWSDLIAAYAAIAGTLVLLAGVRRSGWFWERTSAQLFRKLLGDDGARVAFVVLGVLGVGMGVLIAVVQ